MEPTKQTTVLLVEDDKLLRDILAMKLSKESYKILHALDGESALKTIEEHKPDVVLLDIILPGINGFEVLKRMQENPESKKIPVIFVSNLGQQEDIDRAKALGGVDFYVKANFTADEIVQKLHTYIEEHIKKGDL